MENSEKFIKDFASFIRNASRVITQMVRDLTSVATSITHLLEKMRDRNQWWQQGIGPDADGVYPDNVFSQRWGKDDPPNYDLSA